MLEGVLASLHILLLVKVDLTIGVAEERVHEGEEVTADVLREVVGSPSLEVILNQTFEIACVLKHKSRSIISGEFSELDRKDI